MTDERLHRLLEAAERPLAPRPDFAAALRDELRHELGFMPASGARPIAVGLQETRDRPRRRLSRLLLVAALMAIGVIGLVGIAGSLLERSRDPRSDLFERIQRTRSIRIAIRPDHPQFSMPGQPAAGFDADVAAELAGHLGLRGDIVIVDASAILSGEENELWDIALPSVPEWQVGASSLVSAPYYRWPHRLVVTDASTAEGPGDLSGDRVCAVAGDAGEAWLRGEYGDTALSPIPAEVVTAASDDACFAALVAGDVAALVTARLSDADLQVRSGIRVVGGPEPEPRVIILQRAQVGRPDPTDVLGDVDAALQEMRRDGTLTRLSQSRFGGADVTS